MDRETRIAELNSFGEWLRRRRRALDLTQAQLAQRAGCTAAAIRKFEADERKPSWQLAELLANALEVPDDEHASFLKAARHLKSVAQLPSPVQSPAQLPMHSSVHSRALPSAKRSHNFPAPVTALIDRVRDAANVVQLLTNADVRLLTLLGPPGIGKTRLCIHTAEHVAPFFRDGVWFVDLAPVTDVALVLPAIAHLFAVAEVGTERLLERLRAILLEQELMLVLDNFEQIGAAAMDVAELLRACKGLKVLATSRAPLQLVGEYEYAVPPLSLPPANLSRNITPDRIIEYEAVQLFVARVRQHQYDFAITEANAEQITNICIRLEGIPLALELAAAALRRMSLHQLSAILHDEAKWLQALYSPAYDLPLRQRTLYNAIAWSYSLLDAKTQQIFRQLGVFVDGFDEAAAEAVCGAGQAALMRLVDQSLLARTPERWRMLEMIREFALAQMESEGRDAVQSRFTAYFVSQVAVNRLSNHDAIAREHENFRAALAFAIAAQDTHSALTLCLNLSWFWELRGYLREGMTLARAALAMPFAGEERLRLDALERVSTLAWQAHQFDLALNFIDQMIPMMQCNSYDEALVMSTLSLGRIYIEQGNYARAEAALQECMQVSLTSPHLYSPGFPMAQLGELALARDNWEAAEIFLAQAVPLMADLAETLGGASI